MTQNFVRFCGKNIRFYRVIADDSGCVVFTGEAKTLSREVACVEDAILYARKHHRLFKRDEETRDAAAKENLVAWRQRAERAGFQDELTYDS